ncbi:extracellular solute-binding protein [Marinivivus vitaminiproducens]|uniref:extracellular solute-binding protein n=1 Tax=Marinivivus vitaminiproducens TaxID=3035935 RepID=UPI0027A318F8|nr:extracellular solute-binding protein [Geminicoccaceae bacterium SCSIO 64248]
MRSELESSASPAASAATTRRDLLRAGAAVGAVALGAPWIARRPLASSGEVNVFTWGDYVGAFEDGGIIKSFQDATGIKVNLSTYGSNYEVENKLRAAGGEGFDVVFPTVTNGPNYYPDDLLMALDEAKLNIDAIIPSIYRDSVRLGGTRRGSRYVLPFDWGTEGITWDSSRHDLSYDTLSVSDLWQEGLGRQVAVRQDTSLVALAIYLDAIGEVPSNRALDIYKSEEDMRRIFDACLAYAVPRKSNIGAFWNSAAEATSAFTDAGCTIGQTWDTTGIRLHKEVDPKWRYGLAKEGSMTWLDGIAMPSGAVNVEQGYAFINHLFTPEAGGTFADITGYNSTVQGSEEFLGEAARAAYKMAYPAASEQRLWWWQAETPWFGKLRSEYAEKLTNA